MKVSVDMFSLEIKARLVLKKVWLYKELVCYIVACFGNSVEYS